MKKTNYIVILMLAVFLTGLSGCTGHPKFRKDNYSADDRKKTEDDERLFRSRYKGSKFDGTTTGQLIELGRIIQSFLGRPYKGKSQDRAGLDCSQFTREVFKRFNGTDIPRTVEDQFKYGVKKAKNNIRYGDLVFFRTGGRRISHVGIYIGFNEFVHSSTSSGVIISSMEDKYWKQRFAGIRRIIP